MERPQYNSRTDALERVRAATVQILERGEDIMILGLEPTEDQIHPQLEDALVRAKFVGIGSKRLAKVVKDTEIMWNLKNNQLSNTG